MPPVPGKARHFFLQSCDPESLYVLSETYCGLSTIEKMAEIIGYPTDALTDRQIYLGNDELHALRKNFPIKFERHSYDAILVSWSAEDGLPYRVHSPRELPLMLAKQKPLAFFSDIISDRLPTEKTPEHLFEPYVAMGLFVKREYCKPNLGGDVRAVIGQRIILYALSGEEWRIDAFILLRNLVARTGWSEPLTRMEGSLLGYAEWQNDAFIERQQARNSG